MKIITILAALAASSASAGAALAADPIGPDYGWPVMPVENQFDWNGFYAGVGISGSFFEAGARSYGPGVFLGANAVFDSFLVGVEASAHAGYTDATDEWGYVLGLEGRAGVLVTPEVLAYLSGGVAYLDPAPTDWYASAGGGVEVAVTDSMSIDLHYRHIWADASSANSVSLSALWHF